MAEEPQSTNKQYVSAANRPLSRLREATSTLAVHRSKLLARLGHVLAGTSVISAALLSAFDTNLTLFTENQAQSLFYLIRGPIVPPKNIVILAIDEQSISIGEQYYKTNPQEFSYLEPLRSFPFKRAAYAQVIAKLVQAGARSVAVDVVFDTPSPYGVDDDKTLQQVLQIYGSKVTLAGLYENFATHQGAFTQLTQPQQMFQVGSVGVGSVNFPIEINGKVHKLASEFSQSLGNGDTLTEKVLSFDEAVLRAAQVNYPPPKGDRIHFYGPQETFEQIPFWYVLDPKNWNSYLQQGKFFEDKIVLIGATAQLANDYHSAAAARDLLQPEKMAGGEIHANAIATLMENKAIVQAIPSPEGRGLFVLCLLGGSAAIISWKQRGATRFLSSIGLAIIWGGIGYASFVSGLFILPTAIPVMGIISVGFCYLGTEFAREIARRSQLLDIFRKYSSHRVVQEIISQQEDLKDLLQEREMAISGKILDGRYKIVKVLGAGGFSETYIAEDIKLPGNPQCVVKQLKPANSKPEQLTIARRLFTSEAQTLQKLGDHEQIPKLLAYFEEEEEFYLIQEYIVGHALSQELASGRPLHEIAVVHILQDLLQTLTFVHKNNVIHRDIKPSNIIRRNSDGKLVLIDFGAVKEMTTQLLDGSEHTAFTIGIGTKGYAPSEQCYGRPQYSSDIYAVGMIGIKALTGMAPHDLDRDANGEVNWVDKAQVNVSLANFLSKMVREDFQQRYQSASEALKALEEVEIAERTPTWLPEELPTDTLYLEDSDTPTTPWSGISDESSQSTVKIRD
ncbi:protein kinase [Scytonema hofmannii PCC 7110]|uniref:non-specific serine/threonine protein kinase n=1 Tax=Scytonema hofmannii PCC 7110 TaxID=128403 RepID=A0A139X5X9_9CYAN|nr:serine/threonine-protein kinase [Scytonema hofmannii]KYC40085.1 protein kinase [Scytonema hofmannii PCC 7110]